MSAARPRAGSGRVSTVWAVRNSVTNGLAGRSARSAKVPCCDHRPGGEESDRLSRGRAASRMSWVTSTTVLARRAKSAASCSCSSARTIGSRAPSGSSSSRMGGSSTSARISPTRWRWPPLSSRGYRRSTSPSSPARSASSPTRAAIRAGAPPLRLRGQRDIGEGGQVGVEPAVLHHVAHAGQEPVRGWRAPPGCRPPGPRPRRGQTRPRMSRSRVDLPEPLEPRSTWVVPERTLSDTASRAGVAPKRFVTSWTSITPAFYRKLDNRRSLGTMPGT